MFCKKMQNWFWGNMFAIFNKTKLQFENTLRFRGKNACLELTLYRTCINIVCHCSVLQEECWWNLPCKYPKKKMVLPSFNVACFTAFVTYGLYRKQKHSHFLCKLLSIFHIFLIFTRVCWYLDIFFFLSMNSKERKIKGILGWPTEFWMFYVHLCFFLPKLDLWFCFCF